LQKCCEEEEGDDGDRKQVCICFGKRIRKVYLIEQKCTVRGFYLAY